MRELTVTIKTKTGLHARPAALLVNTVAKGSSKVTIEKNGKEVSLKSIIALLSLGVEENDTVTIKVDGKDEDELIAALNQCAKENEIW